MSAGCIFLSRADVVLHGDGALDCVYAGVFPCIPSVVIRPADYAGSWEPTETDPSFTASPPDETGVQVVEGEVRNAPGPLVRPVGRRGQVLGLWAVLAIAMGEGGLADACEAYGTTDTDVVAVDRYTLRAGGLDLDVLDAGSGPFGMLSDALRHFERMGVPTSVWMPDRYWGNLLDASIFEYIGDGTAPGLAEFGTVPWPWLDIEPADFVPGGAPGNQDLRRILTANEAAVLGLSDDGGVVKRIYIVGPDGHTPYYFSMWPVALDEAG
jgi:hypothetical protein